MNKNLFFSTGEFAKLCGVTKDTLFHYDKMGIFSPQIKLDNGYRYYSPLQYDFFYLIKSLGEIGTTLNEIKEYSQNHTPQNLLELLSCKERDFDKQIKYLKQRKKILSEKSCELKEFIHTKADCITIVKCKEQKLILSKPLCSFDDMSMTLCVSELINRCEENKILHYSSVGGIRYKAYVESGNFNRYSHFYVKSLEKSYKGYMENKPAGEYLLTYYIGEFDLIYTSYNRLLQFAIENQIKLKDKFYEEVFFENIISSNEVQYIVLIMIELDTD